MQVAATLKGDHRFSARYRANAPRIVFRLFALLVVVSMVWAWLERDMRYLEAESGLGYALGIVGVTLMLLLLLYPLRKRMRFMQGWLNIATWFRLHMLLGVLGPCCILLHSNFQLGSTNSTIALSAMLLVAGSGLIGRYLYGKFHYGLYGEQIRLKQLRSDLETFYREIDQGALANGSSDDLDALYHGCCEIFDRQQQSVSLREILRQRKWLKQQKRKLTPALTDQQGELGNHFRALSVLLEKLAGLRLFERLFSLWHVLHIPVFLLMVCTAITHVFVVHWY